MAFALVYQIIVVIHMNHVDPNAPAVRNVPETKLVSEISAKILAPVCVVKMQSVTLLITYQVVLALLITLVTHSHTASQLKEKEHLLKIHAIHRHVDRIVFVELQITRQFVLVLKDSKDLHRLADQNVLLVLNVHQLKLVSIKSASIHA